MLKNTVNPLLAVTGIMLIIFIFGACLTVYAEDNVPLKFYPFFGGEDVAKNYQIYGKICLAINANDATDGIDESSDVPYRVQIDNPYSFIGVKGAWRFNDDLKAFYFFESNIQLGSSLAATLGGKYLQLGLASPYGTLSIGKYDTPYKLSDFFVDPAPFYATSHYNIMGGNNPFGTNSNARVSFLRRPDESIMYRVPVFNGFEWVAMYAVNNDKDEEKNPHFISTSLQYKYKTFSASYAYERHEDIASEGAEDEGHKISFDYALFARGDIKTKIGIAAERLRYMGSLTPDLAKSNDVGNAEEIERDSYMIYLTQFWGKNKIGITYGADTGIKLDGDTIEDSEAQTIGIAYEYLYSKKITAWATAAIILNEDASNNVLYGGLYSQADASPGVDRTSFAVGMSYAF